MSKTLSPSWPARFPWQRWLLILGLLALGLSAWRAREWGQLQLLPALAVVDGRLLLLAFVLNLVYRLVNCTGWGLTIRALHRPVSLVESGRLWLTCESLRWLPGSVWSYGSRTLLAGRLGLGQGFAAASITLELVLTVIAWTLTVAAAGLAGPELLRSLARFPWSGITTGLVLTAALLVGGLCLARSRAATWLERRLAGRFNWRDLARQRPRWTSLGGLVAFYFLLCVFNGLGLWLVLRACPGPVPGLAPVIAANAVGWLVGFFAFFAPGGLGVREAGIAGLLATLIPLEQALLGAALWRLVQVAAEITGLGLALLWGGPRTPRP